MDSSKTISPSLAERYAVLLDTAQTLAMAPTPMALFAAVCGLVRRALPGSSYLIAICEADGELRPMHTEGPDEGWSSFCRETVSRLRVGGTVLEGGHAGGCILAVPLFHRDTFVGCIAVARPPDLPPFESGDTELLQAIGRVGALAIRSAALAVEAERRSREIEQLAAAARDLSASLELDAVVERIAAHAHQWVDAPVVVWLVEGDRVRVAARVGAGGVRVGEESRLPTELVTKMSSGGEGAESAADLAELLSAVHGWLGNGGAEGVRSTIPLVAGRQLVGLLTVGPWTREEDRDAVRLLRRLAPHAASAIDNARMHAELRRLSLTDPLVQLPNRRQLDLVLERDFAAAARGRALCFILFDLDRFKAYNDAYGHREGDVALLKFAEILRTETRTMNLAARYGGEEFAAILSGTGKLGGQMHAERVRRRVMREFGGKLTVSAGVAEYRPGMRTPIDLVIAADRALYRAKQTGRNRVCLADD